MEKDGLFTAGIVFSFFGEPLLALCPQNKKCAQAVTLNIILTGVLSRSNDFGLNHHWKSVVIVCGYVPGHFY